MFYAESLVEDRFYPRPRFARAPFAMPRISLLVSRKGIYSL